MSFIRNTFIVTILLVAMPAAAEKSSTLSGRVLESGVYTKTSNCEEVPNDQLASGYMTFCDYDDKDFQPRHGINRNKDRSFGFVYAISGMNKSKCTTLTHTVRHPIMRVPGKGRIKKQSRHFKVCGDEKSFVGDLYIGEYFWSFDADWERVKGDWRLTVSHKGRELATAQFEVF